MCKIKVSGSGLTPLPGVTKKETAAGVEAMTPFGHRSPYRTEFHGQSQRDRAHANRYWPASAGRSHGTDARRLSTPAQTWPGRHGPGLSCGTNLAEAQSRIENPPI